MVRGSRWLASAGAVALAAVLAACSSTSSAPAESDSLGAVKNGSASTAQLSQVMLDSGKIEGAARVASQQGIELVGDTSALPEEVTMLSDMRITMDGIVAMDGSAGTLSVELGIPGMEPIQTQFLDGKAWITDPATGTWQESQDLADAISRATVASAADFLPAEGAETTYAGTEDVNGAVAHKYVTSFTIDEKFLAASKGLGLPTQDESVNGLLGEVVTATVWVSDDGVPVKFVAEIPMLGVVTDLVPGGAESLTGLDEILFMYELTFSDVGKVSAPTAPPVQGA